MEEEDCFFFFFYLCCRVSSILLLLLSCPLKPWLSLAGSASQFYVLRSSFLLL